MSDDVYYITEYRGFKIYYDTYYDEYFIVGFPFYSDYGYYYIEDALNAIDDYWYEEFLYC